VHTTVGPRRVRSWPCLLVRVSAVGWGVGSDAQSLPSWAGLGRSGSPIAPEGKRGCTPLLKARVVLVKPRLLLLLVARACLVPHV
jgi:hypothetical protein